MTRILNTLQGMSRRCRVGESETGMWAVNWSEHANPFQEL